MKIKLILYALLVIISSCKNASIQNNNIAVANQFIDAFYSFNNDSLLSILSQTDKSKQSILYYQGWAKCGNYEIINRHGYIVGIANIKEKERVKSLRRARKKLEEEVDSRKKIADKLSVGENSLYAYYSISLFLVYCR